MDDSRCRQFFAEASSTTYHRQYEALRAVFYEERSQKEVAEQFGYTYGSLRQLVHGFRKSVRDGLPTPFFESLVSADRRST
jgi:DNA-directed RNA polymerase specialized sigma24 family protein